MLGLRTFGSVAAVLLLCGSVQAQTAQPPVPPQNAMKLSEIIARIEQRDQFRYIDEVDWDEEGYYEVTYYTTDKAKVEIRIDPATGEPR
ncbi:PepSY domain-containing protein [Pseudaminobacter arsenicus]|uniref:PepSY domain-containing protein n=1 Tax=Borborobacter arsenicus TaxID=1851146 RepID=A0A432V095_9HYPH|nr:PepSY domain-containing protein [Pseudaminobacter arsenicus]RUM95505.1 PepSY domain-containing protein [Pseudaminobacter arsenicus]